MKVRSSLLAFLLVFSLVSTVHAQDMRTYNGYADISFSGTTATCYAEIVGNSGKDKISATVELCCGSQNIATWERSSDNGYLMIQETASVTKGKTYELTVKYSVNGKTQPSFSDTGTCR